MITEAETKVLGVDILADAATYQNAGEPMGWTSFPLHKICGAPEPINLWGLSIK